MADFIKNLWLLPISIILFVVVSIEVSADLSYSGNAWVMNASCGGSSRIRDFTIDTAHNLLIILTDTGYIQTFDVSTGSARQRTCDNTIPGISTSVGVEYDEASGRLLTDQGIYSITMFGNTPIINKVGNVASNQQSTRMRKVPGSNDFWYGAGSQGTLNCGNYPDSGAFYWIGHLTNNATVWSIKKVQGSRQNAGYVQMFVDSAGHMIGTQFTTRVFNMTQANFIPDIGGFSLCGPEYENWFVPSGASNFTRDAVPYVNAGESSVESMAYDASVNILFYTNWGLGIYTRDMTEPRAQRGFCDFSGLTSYTPRSFWYLSLNETYVFVGPQSQGMPGAYKCDFTNIINPVRTAQPSILGSAWMYKKFSNGIYANKLYIGVSGSAYWGLNTPTRVRAITGFTNSQAPVQYNTVAITVKNLDGVGIANSLVTLHGLITGYSATQSTDLSGMTTFTSVPSDVFTGTFSFGSGVPYQNGIIPSFQTQGGLPYSTTVFANGTTAANAPYNILQPIKSYSAGSFWSASWNWYRDMDTAYGWAFVAGMQMASLIPVSGNLFGHDLSDPLGIADPIKTYDLQSALYGDSVDQAGDTVYAAANHMVHAYTSASNFGSSAESWNLNFSQVPTICGGSGCNDKVMAVAGVNSTHVLVCTQHTSAGGGGDFTGPRLYLLASGVSGHIVGGPGMGAWGPGVQQFINGSFPNPVTTCNSVYYDSVNKLVIVDLAANVAVFNFSQGVLNYNFAAGSLGTSDLLDSPKNWAYMKGTKYVRAVGQTGVEVASVGMLDFSPIGYCKPNANVDVRSVVKVTSSTFAAVGTATDANNISTGVFYLCSVDDQYSRYAYTSPTTTFTISPKIPVVVTYDSSAQTFNILDWASLGVYQLPGVNATLLGTSGAELRTVNVQGQPIFGVSVTLVSGAATYTQISDTNGLANFTNIVSGTYSVFATPLNFYGTKYLPYTTYIPYIGSGETVRSTLTLQVANPINLTASGLGVKMVVLNPDNTIKNEIPGQVFIARGPITVGQWDQAGWAVLTGYGAFSTNGEFSAYRFGESNSEWVTPVDLNGDGRIDILDAGPNSLNVRAFYSQTPAAAIASSANASIYALRCFISGGQAKIQVGMGTPDASRLQILLKTGDGRSFTYVGSELPTDGAYPFTYDKSGTYEVQVVASQVDAPDVQSVKSCNVTAVVIQRPTCEFADGSAEFNYDDAVTLHGWLAASYSSSVPQNGYFVLSGPSARRAPDGECSYSTVSLSASIIPNKGTLTVYGANNSVMASITLDAGAGQITAGKNNVVVPHTFSSGEPVSLDILFDRFSGRITYLVGSETVYSDTTAVSTIGSVQLQGTMSVDYVRLVASGSLVSEGLAPGVAVPLPGDSRYLLNCNSSAIESPDIAVRTDFKNLRSYCISGKFSGDRPCNDDYAALQEVVNRYPACAKEAYNYCVYKMFPHKQNMPEGASSVSGSATCSAVLGMGAAWDSVAAPSISAIWTMIWSNQVAAIVVILLIVIAVPFFSTRRSR